MRKLYTLLVMSILMIAIGCSKSTTTPDGNTSTLKFEQLVAQDTVIQVNGITKVTAKATGEGLAYKWTASYGTFIGSGAEVQWTVCHMDKFSITCEVKDKNNNSQTKTVYIRTIE